MSSILLPAPPRRTADGWRSGFAHLPAREIGALIPGWLAACQERGFLELRIIHGKGIGNLQRTVHAILSRYPEVERYSLAGPHYGGTGATIVHLRPSVRKQR